METLAPRAAYHADIAQRTRGWRRVLLFYYGIWFGVVSFATLTDWQLSGKALLHSALFAAGVAIWAGALFGYALTWFTVRQRTRLLQRIADRIYDGDSALVPEPPADATHRLPCRIMIAGGRGVSGVLYVRPTGLLFQGIRFRNSLWRRTTATPRPVIMEPPREIVVQRGEVRPSWRGRTVSVRGLSVLVVRWPGHVAAFRVPVLDEVLPQLERCVSALRYEGSAP